MQADRWMVGSSVLFPRLRLVRTKQAPSAGLHRPRLPPLARYCIYEYSSMHIRYYLYIPATYYYLIMCEVRSTK